MKLPAALLLATTLAVGVFSGFLHAAESETPSAKPAKKEKKKPTYHSTRAPATWEEIYALAQTSRHPRAEAERAELARLVPAQGPRTLVAAGRRDAFRAYCTNGDGRTAYEKIKEDFDREYLNQPFPEEPLTYGDPDPKTRDTEKANLWRAAQDVSGRIASVAEAATVIWIVTGEEKYLAKAKEFLLKSTEWSLDASRWAEGPQRGTTDIYYNDEAHFRLWRKLPLVYDQLRDQFSPEEKKKIVDHFRQRGLRSVAWIKAAKVESLKQNSLEEEASSHPVRFMAMTAASALALWDDLPETREWWRFVYVFYRDQFPPWGGEEGGWAEGAAYWRGTIEHAAFQDTLLMIGDPLAYNTPFWRNSPLFAVYNIQPYLATQFGDLANAGKINLEPMIAHYLQHVARVQRNGSLVSYTQLFNDPRPMPQDGGLKGLDRRYPNSTEFLLRQFSVSHLPLPEPKPLSELPASRFFKDVGYVSMHSALGRPEEDIHITFKSSPYGSFSHSHADQNAFILNAYGANLAINSGYREFHNSPHHRGWVRLTKSKNALLIDGKGQKPQDKRATGTITRYEVGDRFVWTTGDATVAYQAEQPKGPIEKVLRDLVFIDQRYVVVRDHVRLKEPVKVSWLLHTENALAWDAATATARTVEAGVSLTTQLVASKGGWNASVKNEYDVPVDASYVSGNANYFSTGKWTPQTHLTAETKDPATQHLFFAVLWPERDGTKLVELNASLEADGTLVIKRPDGKTDRLVFDDDRLKLD